MQLVDLARFHGIKALAITDHDEIAANLIAINYNRNDRLEIVPGVELSIDYILGTSGHLHLVGLWVHPESDELNTVLYDLREARKERAGQIIIKLNEIGIKIRPEDLAGINHNGYVGRPHFAHLLLSKGYVRTLYDAYRQYLGDKCPAYIPKKKLALQPALNLIHRAGGIAILAHPFSLGYSNYDLLGSEILKLKELGLDGIEAFNPNYDQAATDWLMQFAVQNRLLVSGGSDFHGDMKPGISLGSGHGNLQVPDALMVQLKSFRNS